VTSLGHAYPVLVHTLFEEARKIWHTSNFYGYSERARLAEKLVKLSFADKVFFCNSGLEAFEGAVKLARGYHYARGDEDRHHVISFEGGFHGRSSGALFTMSEGKRIGFGPVPEGSVSVPLYDEEALSGAISEKTAAVIVEPVQGEGGVNVVKKEFLRHLRSLADTHGFLLIFDEVQCGMGRTGRLWAYEDTGVEPDIMMVAKGLGSGFPVGAVLARKEVSKGFSVGRHGTTFGGNPLAMAVASVTVDVISQPDFLVHIAETGAYLKEKLEGLVTRRSGFYKEQRGLGLMQGLVVTRDPMDMTRRLAERGLLVIPTGGPVIRLLPPFVVGREEVDRAVDILEEVV
jgi:acetylornithine/N-succinyldiaminopimelate aminotransferase